MLTTLLGLPAHPLLVHGVVVLLPLMAVATAVVAWRPAWWPRLAILVAAGNLVVFGLTVLAKESGERLEHQVRRTAAVHEHAELGDPLPALAGLLLVCSLVPAYLAWRDRRRLRPGSGGASTWAAGDAARARHDRTPQPLGVPRALALATSVATTVVGLAVLYLTFRVGHTGAEAVWGELGRR